MTLILCKRFFNNFILAMILSNVTLAVANFISVKAWKENLMWLCKCPLLFPEWPNALTPEAIVL